jgi:hypothetical protein
MEEIERPLAVFVMDVRPENILKFRLQMEFAVRGLESGIRH